MARARNIKPGVMENEELAELDPLARLLFIYLWMLADREGRLEDRPKRIKAKALPYDEVDADAILCALHADGFIARYEIDGARFIQITNFLKHQKPHSNEVESVIPPMVEGLSTLAESHSAKGKTASPATSADESAAPSPNVAGGSLTKHVDVDSPSEAAIEPELSAAITPESLASAGSGETSNLGEKPFAPSSQALGPCISDSHDSLIADSLIPSLPSGAPQSGEAVAMKNSAAPQAAGEREGKSDPQGSLLPAEQADVQRVAAEVGMKPSPSDAMFALAWAAYPKRSGGNSRADAFKAWAARVKQGKHPADMVAGVKRYAAYQEAKGNIGTEYVKTASAFFGPGLHFEEPWDIPAATSSRSQGGGFMTTQDRNRAISEANIRAALADDEPPLDMLPPPNDPYTIDME